MADEAVEHLAFWLFKRDRADWSLRQRLDAWTALPAAARRQWLEEARDALAYCATGPT